MMNQVLQIVSTLLNEHLKNAMQIQDEKCVISNLINLDKTIPTEIQNKIVISFINLEEAHLSSVAIGYKGGIRDNDLKRLELSVLIAFNLNTYNESLVYLTSVFSFLQSNPLLYAQEDNKVSPVSKLTLDLQSLNTESLADIWSCIGAPYIPSLVYKMRVLYRSQDHANQIKPIISS